LITKTELKTKGASALGAVAGTVVDPKTGLMHLKSKALPILMVAGAGLVVGILVGYRIRRRQD
jgi:xanthosine utilization system XapX-like protein